MQSAKHLDQLFTNEQLSSKYIDVVNRFFSDGDGFSCIDELNSMMYDYLWCLKKMNRPGDACNAMMEMTRVITLISRLTELNEKIRH